MYSDRHNQQLMQYDIPTILQEHFAACINYSTDYYQRDLIEEALSVYCDGQLLDYPQHLALSETISSIFLPWVCLRWSYHERYSISECYSAAHNKIHTLLLTRAQQTPFAFYQVRKSSNPKKYIKVKHLLTGRGFNISAAHIETQHSCKLRAGEIIFAMIDVELYHPVVYAIAPHTLHKQLHHSSKLDSIHQQLRHCSNPPELVLQSPLYDDIAHLTYLHALISNQNSNLLSNEYEAQNPYFVHSTN